MRFSAAVVKEQGVTFTVLKVKSGYLTQDNLSASQTSAPQNLPRPIILMEDSSQGPRYLGRRDIVNFLSGVYVEQLPWQKFEV